LTEGVALGLGLVTEVVVDHPTLHVTTGRGRECLAQEMA
jgi:hypothetical protein